MKAEGREYGLKARKTIQLCYGEVRLFLPILPVDGYSGSE